VPLRVIGAGRFELSGVDIESLQWSADTEVADLQGCDIGLVPLLDDPWSPWKFFFKTVQYMAVGLPVVARRMGSNCEVIREGENGFLVETPDEWHDRLHLLVHDNALRRQMGQAARRTVVEHYSTQVQIPKLVSIFDQVYESRIGCGPNVACSDPHR
jgi:glycosyltransferase involved in cell wall biosynthesis